jgi:hypothetical protein
MQKLESYLKSEGIDYILCSSQGRLSKYYNDAAPAKTFPMKVVREGGVSRRLTHLNVNEATDLFDKYQKSHAVTRLHLDFEQLPAQQKSHIIQIINSN